MEEKAKKSLGNQYLKSIMDTVIYGVIAIQANGRILLFNHAAERIFGYKAAEVIGKDISILMPESEGKKHQGYVDRYIATGDAHIIGYGREVIAVKKDGTEFPLHLVVNRFDYEGKPQFVGIVRDLTAFKEAEQARSEKASLLSLLEDQQKLNRMRAFLASEMQLPLVDMIARADYLLKTMYQHAMGGEYIKFVQDIHDSCRYIMHHLSDLDEGAKTKDSQAELNQNAIPTDIAQTIKDVQRFMGDFTFDHKALLSVNIAQDLPKLKADELIIKQILHNLVYHSLRHNKNQAKVNISALCDTDDNLTIIVSDNMRGVTKEILKSYLGPELLPNGNQTNGAKMGLFLACSIARHYNIPLKIEADIDFGLISKLTFTADQTIKN